MGMGNKGLIMKKRGRAPLLTALWLMFLLMIAGIAFLSFQNGEDAKEYGDKLIHYLTNWFTDKTMSVKEVEATTYMVRQCGRALAFLLLGIVGTLAIHGSLVRCRWGVRTAVTVALLIVIAVLTERLKIYIPTRHFDYIEMVISMISVVAGFLVATILTRMFRPLRECTYTVK